MDKAFWTAVLEAEFAVPEGHTPRELLPELMAGLGSIDPVMRDTLCLEILGAWIEAGHYAPDVIRQVTGQLLANLKSGIGEGENDQVFLRTFSVLILGSIVGYDARVQFLTPNEVQRIMEAGLAYLAAEQDLRGYVPVKGWAHSAAHTADLLAALAGHPAVGAGDLARILDAIAAKVLAPTEYPFLENEDGRLGRAVLAVVRRELVPPDRWVSWLEQLGGTEPRQRSFVPGRDSAMYHNARGFLRALHLMLSNPTLPALAQTDLKPAVYATMKSFTPWGL